MSRQFSENEEKKLRRNSIIIIIILLAPLYYIIPQNDNHRPHTRSSLQEENQEIQNIPCLGGMSIKQLSKCSCLHYSARDCKPVHKIVVSPSTRAAGMWKQPLQVSLYKRTPLFFLLHPSSFSWLRRNTNFSARHSGSGSKEAPVF